VLVLPTLTVIAVLFGWRRRRRAPDRT
jgi:ABC-type uncharacterized transport system involved in gliding motility auxiliary subunit